MPLLIGKTALITGGNKGIGKGIALGLASEGASLVIVGRDAQALEKTRAEMTARCFNVLAVPADVTDERQVLDIFAKTLAKFGRLDILVNNAGAFDGAPLDE